MYRSRGGHCRAFKRCNFDAEVPRGILWKNKQVIIFTLLFVLTGLTIAGTILFRIRKGVESDLYGDCGAYMCHNGVCLGQRRMVCDGKDDCGDNSDEYHCG